MALKRPYVGLLLYFFVYYMHPPGKYWGSFLPEMRWTLIVALITLISTFIHEKNLKAWLKPKETKWLLALFSYICLQMTWVNYPSLHQEYLVLLFKLVILYFIIVTLVNTEKRLIGVIVANAIGAAYIGLEAIQTHQSGRFEAAGLPGIKDGNLLAIHLIPIILMTSVLILTNIKRRYLVFFPLALVANLFFMTGSRGGLVGLVIAGLFFIWYSPKEKKTQVFKWAGIAALLGSMLLGPLIAERMNKVINAQENEEVDKSAYTRIVVIEAQWEMFKDNPVLGFGHRGTLIQSPYYVAEEYMTETAIGGRRASHNITMSFLVDHGLVGSFFFLFLVVGAVYKVKIVNAVFEKNPRVALVLLSCSSGLLGVMVSSQFSNSKVLEISIWMIALIAAISLIMKKDEKHNLLDKDE
ncbi:O-antigen ligase family protein [Psychrosphaera haliotis]|uniref:O-antigen ligase family protein n=1 Tax=Psychrosphaera haliotis TaxID=555083 RepID=UPI0018C806D5